jgi:membrane fusion protein (multidrug efflux system)
VQPKDFTQTLHATGTLNARQEATVRAKVSGEIEHVYVDIGDQVKEGDKLMKIQDIDFKLKLQQEKAQLAKAKATLETSKREMKRVKGLYKAGSATKQKKDQAETAYQQAKADYQQNQAAKSVAQQQLNYTSIQAPFSGVVTKRNYKKGDYASTGHPAAQVTDLSVMEANMDIPERYAGSVKKGLPVTLHFQSQIQPVKGKVTAVNPKIDTDTRTFLVKVTVQNSGHRLPAGLFFKADFALPKMKNQPAVPAEAVQKSRGQDILWVIKHGRAHRQVVQTGPQNGGWVMIRQGVQKGDTVAVGGVGSLIDGYPVNTSAVDSLAGD